MKLTIKLTELLTLLNNRVPHSGIVFTDVEIDRTVPVVATATEARIDYELPIVQTLHRAVAPYLNKITGGELPWADKIGAIKALRFITAYRPTIFSTYGGQSMNLADAKYAVENWAKFLAYVTRHRSLPTRGFAFTLSPLDQ